jgi:hypothetical protein
MSTNDCTHESLLLREFEDTQNWMRIGIQIYFGWYAFFFTLNGAAAALLFSGANSLARTAPLVRILAIAFTVWSILSVISAFAVLCYFVQRCQRLKQIMLYLSSQLDSGEVMRPNSPVSHVTFAIIFGITVVTITCLAVLWVLVAVRPTFLTQVRIGTTL